jgi:hypothetical protein
LLIKGISSLQVFGCGYKDSDRIISDMFIFNNIFIAIFNFKFIIIIDINNFEIISTSLNQKFSNLLVLDELFKDSYNKCLYVLPIQEQLGKTTADILQQENEYIEEDLKTNVGVQSLKKIQFYIITKNFTKYVSTILKLTHKTKLNLKILKFISDTPPTETNIYEADIFKLNGTPNIGN